MTKTDTKKKAMVQALEKSLGVVSVACDMVGIARQTHYTWLNEDEEYSIRVKDVANRTLDFVETALFGQVDKGNISAIIFYLKTKGRERGYIEHQQIGIDANERFKINITAFEEGRD